jgi:hypothetical protein
MKGFSLAMHAFIENIFLFLDNMDEYKLGTGSIKSPVQSRSNSKNNEFFRNRKKKLNL